MGMAKRAVRAALPILALGMTGCVSLESIDGWFGTYLVAPLEAVIFFQVGAAPLVIWSLALGGVFFTLRYRFINILGLRHCIDVIRGKYDKGEDAGEISHFQAMSAALSATVGLGNIAGVAVAIAVGGPGSVFWMWVAALFGMSAKFSSCMFSQVYRDIDPQSGRVLGGPMHYIRQGLAETRSWLAGPGKVMAALFALLTIGGALGGGNLFQSNQTHAQLASALGLADQSWFAMATVNSAGNQGRTVAKAALVMAAPSNSVSR